MMPLMPVRALGAPQTTWMMPVSVSTLHSRSLSALGCFSASMHIADLEGRQRLGHVGDLFDLEPDADQTLADLVERGRGVEMVLEPGEGEFHDKPPASVGTCSA